MRSGSMGKDDLWCFQRDDKYVAGNILVAGRGIRAKVDRLEGHCKGQEGKKGEGQMHLDRKLLVVSREYERLLP